MYFCQDKVYCLFMVYLTRVSFTVVSKRYRKKQLNPACPDLILENRLESNPGACGIILNQCNIHMNNGPVQYTIPLDSKRVHKAGVLFMWLNFINVFVWYAPHCPFNIYINDRLIPPVWFWFSNLRPESEPELAEQSKTDIFV